MTSESRPSATVVFVDDDDWARIALAQMLKDPDIEIVASCATVEDGLRAIEDCKPRVALVDMQLHGDPRAGIGLIRCARDVSPDTACAVLTATAAGGEYLAEALLAGAHGYYGKGYAQGERLPEIVKRLAEGNWDMDPRLAKAVKAYLDGEHETASKALMSATPRLTNQESAVLDLIANGLNRNEISERLVITPNTVKTHTDHIFNKLEVSSVEQVRFIVKLTKYLQQFPDEAARTYTVPLTDKNMRSSTM